MARVQVLPLAPQTVGDVTSTPYVLIFDGIEDDRDADGNPVFTPEMLETLAGPIPAASVWVVSSTLSVGNVDQELHDAAHAAVLRSIETGHLPVEVRQALAGGSDG